MKSLILSLLFLITSTTHAEPLTHQKADNVLQAWYLIQGDIDFSKFPLKTQQCIDIQLESDNEMDYQEAIDICENNTNGVL